MGCFAKDVNTLADVVKTNLK